MRITIALLASLGCCMGSHALAEQPPHPSPSSTNSTQIEIFLQSEVHSQVSIGSDRILNFNDFNSLETFIQRAQRNPEQKPKFRLKAGREVSWQSIQKVKNLLKPVIIDLANPSLAPSKWKPRSFHFKSDTSISINRSVPQYSDEVEKDPNLIPDQPVEELKPEDLISFTIGKDKKYFYHPLKGDKMEMANFEEVKKMIKARTDAHQEKLKLFLHCHRSVEWKEIQKWKQAATQLGVTSVSFKALSPAKEKVKK